MASNGEDNRGQTSEGEKEIILNKVTATVQKIHIDGVGRTKNDVITKHVKRVFDAKNFEEMVMRSQQARASLERLGLFKRVRIGIDVNKGAEALPNGYDVTFNVKESRRITGGVSTMVGTNDGSVLFNIQLPNVFGRGEKINTEYTYGTKNALGAGLSFTKPLQGDPNLMFQTSLFQNSGEFPWSGYKEVDRGVAAELMFPTLLGAHNLRWEGVWREVGCLSQTTAFRVREQCGHSAKSAIKHVLVRDTRDNRVLPTEGYKIQLSQELAGLGGDANFMKAEGELHYNLKLPLDTVVQLCLGAGVMKPIQPGSELHISDRYFLGGPLTLRGFNLKGVGPHEDGSALGADTYWCGGLHLYTPLPFRPGKGGFGDLFRLHGFVNAGNLTNIDFKDDYRNTLRSLSQGLRWSYGAGVVLKLGGIARLELNYCWPMSFQQGDSLNPGLQLGVGVGFL